MKKVFLIIALICTPALAQNLGVPIQTWLELVRPTVATNLCTNSTYALLEHYTGPSEQCIGTVEPLFEQCTTTVPNVILPDFLMGISDERALVQTISECVSAYYLGGDLLEEFERRHPVPEERAH